jgi:hypothetical protein
MEDLLMFRYNQTMSDNDKKTPEFDRLLTDEELALAIKRGKDADEIQRISGNPQLDAEQIAMFEMFERERWSHEKCRAYISERWKKRLSEKK